MMDVNWSKVSRNHSETGQEGEYQLKQAEMSFDTFLYLP